LPVDGSLLLATLNNPANGPGALTNAWLWVYADGLAVNSGVASAGASWSYSVEAVPLADPAHSGGGPGTQTTGAINVNPGADPYLTLDPLAGDGACQIVAFCADSLGTVLPVACEITYEPLYLYPR